jgi:hypothetical protein
MTVHTPPSALVADLRRLTTSELSAIVTALLITEPSLPLRASIALAVLAVIGASWIGFAVWVLSHTRVLLGRHRVVAARMAVAFSGVFCLGAVAVGYVTSSRSAFAAAAMGAVMIAIGCGMLIRARRHVEQLSTRRDELERQLGRKKQ